MSEKNQTANETVERGFSITREFNAPLDLLWAVHTEPAHLMNWWGPKGFKMLKADMDLRPGGMFHYGLQAPDGSEMWGRFIYRKIEPKTLLEFIVSFSDNKGGMVRHPMAQDWPMELLNEATFTEKDGKTTLVIKGQPINASDAEIEMYYSKFAQDSMKQGFGGTYDELDVYLANIQ
jgi:uncharacterized protein YndB with AHSA1/START domain